jgi:hypothetical protein
MMANSLEYRGKDATGIALVQSDGKLFILKNHEPAWKFTAGKEFDSFMKKHLGPQTRMVLVHTRAYTKGNPLQNNNNHPMYAGAGCIIHNGMISNDEALFNNNKDNKHFKRSGETDSDILRAILDFHGGVDEDIFDEMSKISGVAAVAAYHPATPDKLLLLRDTNPLIIGCTQDMFAFASDKTSLHRCLKPWVRLHNLTMQVHAPDISFLPMPNESAWIIGPSGFESHGRFDANASNRSGNRTYCKDVGFKAKHEALARTSTSSGTFDSTKVKVITPPPAPKPNLVRFVICPSEKCSKHVEIERGDQDLTTYGYLACQACGTNLAGAILADPALN